MPTKRKDQPLKEFVESIEPGTFVTIPWANITREEYKWLLSGINPLQRMLDLGQRASTRDLVLEVVGMLDEVLTLALRKRVKPESAEQLFGNGGKIKDFEAKIELAYGLDLLPDGDRSYLNVYRKIRNRFAHEPDLHHFEIDDKVLGLVRSLPNKFNDQNLEVPLRFRFVDHAVTLYAKLTERGGEPENRQNPGKADGGDQ